MADPLYVPSRRSREAIRLIPRCSGPDSLLRSIHDLLRLTPSTAHKSVRNESQSSYTPSVAEHGMLGSTYDIPRHHACLGRDRRKF